MAARSLQEGVSWPTATGAAPSGPCRRELPLMQLQLHLFQLSLHSLLVQSGQLERGRAASRAGRVAVALVLLLLLVHFCWGLTWHQWLAWRDG